MTNETKMDRVGKPAPTKRKKIASLDRRKARAGWIFVLPFVIGFVLVYLPMFIEALTISFVEMHTVPGGGYTYEFVGFGNYQAALFNDVNYLQMLINGLGQMLFDIPAILIFSLFIAVLMNQKMVGRAAFRAIFFVPVVLSTGVMETVNASNVFDSYMGSTEGINNGSGQSAANEIVSAMDVEQLFAGMKIGTELTLYVSQTVNNIFDIVNRSGVQLLIFLAALQSISPAIYESCRIDGATSWETFWKITLPMISPMILVNGIYTVIDAFTMDSNPVISYINSKMAMEMEMGTAMYMIFFLIVILIVALVAGIFSAFVFYQRRDM